MRFGLIASLLTAFFILTACAPEVGSEAWCKSMKDTPKSEWTASQASDYAENCIF